MSKIFQALILNLIIPVAGYFLMLNIMNEFLDGYPIELGLELCRGNSDPACGTFMRVYYTHMASLYSAIAAVLLALILIISSYISNNNRKLIASIFPKLIPLTIFIVAIQMLVQGVIFTYGVYVLESYYLGRVHYFLIGAAGLAAGGAALKVISSMSSVSSSMNLKVLGTKINKDNRLWDLVNSIASKVEASPPDNIIVGLEPGFYITAAKVTIISGNDKDTIHGETLYLSLPLVRLYNDKELSAIIGHELAHFKGEDTQYSLKFAPVYVSLQSALHDSSENASVLSAPGLIFLNSILSLFSSSVGKISRERELIADQVGISAGGKEGLAYSLVKFAIFQQSWNTVIKDAIDECNQGKFITNMSKAFMNNSKFDFSNSSIQETLKDIGSVSTPHPTDSHPPISERLKQCEISTEEMSIDQLNNHGNAKDYIDDLESIEEDLTYIEHMKLVALGLIKQPKETSSEEETQKEDQKNFMLNAIYHIASAMIYADGKIEKEEVQVAETIGKKLIPEFNSSTFREFINQKPKTDLFEKLISYFSFMDAEAKKLIFNYLNAIANADNDLAKEEQELLDLVKKSWQLEDN